MKEQLINAAHASLWASSWVERNKSVEADLRECALDLEWDIDNTALSLKHAANNISHKQTVGVFGASQAGKSYLVSKMSAGGEKDLTTTWDGLTIDFIRHVNPQGNQSEATGFATRFTHDKTQTPQGFPVDLKIVTELEIAMILINGFFKDIVASEVRAKNDNVYLKHLATLAPYVDTKAQELYYSFPHDDLKSIKGNLAEDALDFQSLALSDSSIGRVIEVNGKKEFNYITPEQVVELANYVARNSSGKIKSADEMPDFWSQARAMLPFMNLEGRCKFFSFFWNDLVVLNRTYYLLASALLEFEGHSHIFVQQNAFINMVDNRPRQTSAHGGTIMHINKIDYIFDEDIESLKCAWTNANGSEVVKEVYIRSSIVAALALELTFSLDSNNGTLDDFDVIDFPGARSRGGVHLADIEKDGANNVSDKAKELLRRGKVEYIFDRYSHRNEIDQLLFCIGVIKQQDVVDATSILTDWINENIGKDKEKRAKISKNPLTLVLTQYDTVFNRGRTSLENDQDIDLDGEIKKSFEQLNKVNWFSEWTPGNPFDRVFLARKPNLGNEATPWLAFDANKQELGINESARDDIERIKQSLLSHEPFAEHIANFAEKLELVLSLNDGGVSRIVEEVRNNALPEKMRESLRANKSEQALQKLLPRLQEYATRDSAKAFATALKDSKYIALGLIQCNNLSPCFDRVRTLLEIPDEKLEEIYGREFSSGSNVQRFVHDSCTEYMDNLAMLWRRDCEPLKNIASSVSKAYELRLPNFEADPRAIEAFSFFFDEERSCFKSPDEVKEDIIALFNKLFNEIGKAFNSSMIGLKNYMVQVLLDAENTSSSYGDIVKIQVKLLQFILSDFNLYLGANLLPSRDDQQLADSVELTANISDDELDDSDNFAPVNYGADDDDDDFDDFAGFDDDDDDGYSVAPVKRSLSKNVAHITPSRSALEAAFKGGVLGSQEGPINHFNKSDNLVTYDENKQDYEVFTRKYAVDDTGILPHLDEKSNNFEFNLISDYVSTLMYIMCKVNVFSDSKYQFSADENMLLCRILATMEAVK